MTFQSSTMMGNQALARRPAGDSPVTAQLRDSLVSAQKVLSRHTHSRVTTRVWKLADRHANWDGYGSAAPNNDSIARAAAWIDELISLLSDRTLAWTDPHIGSDENGDVVLEWRNAGRKLTVYVQPDSTEYIKSWGPDIEDEMESGALGAAGFLRLWEWLQR